MRPGLGLVAPITAGVLLLMTAVSWSLWPDLTGPAAPTPLPALACPAQVASDLGASSGTFVPHQPAGVTVWRHLAPAQAPRTAVVCQFQETSMPTGVAPPDARLPLTAHTQVTGAAAGRVATTDGSAPPTLPGSSRRP